jgi:hypothetical protein
VARLIPIPRFISIGAPHFQPGGETNRKRIKTRAMRFGPDSAKIDV